MTEQEKRIGEIETEAANCHSRGETFGQFLNREILWLCKLARTVPPQEK